MRTIFAAALIGAVAVAASAAQQQPAVSANDDAAIRKVITDLDATRNAGGTISAAFAADADQLTSSGEWRVGPSGIEKGYEVSHTTVYKGGKYVTKLEKIRMIAPNVAIADGPFEVQNIPGGTRHAHVSYVLVQTGGQWRISAVRSMVSTPPGPTPAK